MEDVDDSLHDTASADSALELETVESRSQFDSARKQDMEDVQEDPCNTAPGESAMETEAVETPRYSDSSREARRSARATAPTEAQTSIQDISSELLALIFSYLDTPAKVSVAAVCSHWRGIIDIPSVWKDFTATVNLDTLTLEDKKKMQRRRIRRVRVQACSNVQKLVRLVQSMPWLEHLDMSGILISEDDLRDVFKQDLSRLTSLSIYCVMLNTEALESVSKQMVSLQHLSIVALTQNSLLCGVKQLKHLRSLSIRVAFGGLQDLGRSPVEIPEAMPCLKTLALNRVSVEDTGLECLTRVFPQLNSLTMTLSPDVTGVGIDKLAQLKELTYLSIVTTGFSDDWMERLKKGLPKLKYLCLLERTGVPVRCLEFIASMPTVEALKINISSVEVEGLRALSQGCPALKRLELGYGNFRINEGLEYLCRLPKLEDLYLFNCKVKDLFWQTNAHNFPQLNILSLDHCLCLTDISLKCMSRIPCLKELYLRNCENIGNRGMNYLGRAGRHLTILLLEKIGISDLGLRLLSRRLRSLRTLAVFSCERVTERGVVAAVSNFPSLQQLLGNFSANTKRRLMLLRPGLRLNV